MEFKDRIKLLREEKGLNLTQLAVAFDMREAGVRAWELGRTKPSADTLIKLAEYFDCSVDYLIGLNSIRNQAQINMLDDSYELFSQTFGKLSPQLQNEFLDAVTALFKFMPLSDNKEALSGKSFHALLSLISSLGFTQSNIAEALLTKEIRGLTEDDRLTHFIAQYENKNMARLMMDRYFEIVGELEKRILDIKNESEHAWYMERLREGLRRYDGDPYIEEAPL